jgi:aryl-alcohol dehydrogenase-like predicted oxidoreductase
VRRQIDTSLHRLGVDRVDLYLAHAWDEDVPVSETVGAFDELVSAGKVGAYGFCNVDSTQLGEALALAPVAAVQNSYSLLDRRAEPVISLCAVNNVWFQAHSPLMGGWLTGKYRRDTPAPEGSRMTLRSGPYEYLRDDRVYEALEALARRGHPATLALGWLLADERVSVVIGPRRPVHLGPALDALANPLTQEERDALSDDFRLVPQS